MRLDDGAGAAAHHRQVHHQTKGLPVHQVGGGAVVSTGEVDRLLNPTGAADPEPTAGWQGFFLALHPRQQRHFLIVQSTQLPQASEIALANLAPAFTAISGFAAVGPVKNRVSGWSGGGKVAETGAVARSDLHAIRGQGHVR